MVFRETGSDLASSPCDSVDSDDATVRTGLYRRMDKSDSSDMGDSDGYGFVVGRKATMEDILAVHRQLFHDKPGTHVAGRDGRPPRPGGRSMIDPRLIEERDGKKDRRRRRRSRSRSRIRSGRSKSSSGSSVASEPVYCRNSGSASVASAPVIASCSSRSGGSRSLPRNTTVVNSAQPRRSSKTGKTGRGRGGRSSSRNGNVVIDFGSMGADQKIEGEGRSEHRMHGSRSVMSCRSRRVRGSRSVATASTGGKSHREHFDELLEQVMAMKRGRGGLGKGGTVAGSQATNQMKENVVEQCGSQLISLPNVDEQCYNEAVLLGSECRTPRKFESLSATTQDDRSPRGSPDEACVIITPEQAQMSDESSLHNKVEPNHSISKKSRSFRKAPVPTIVLKLMRMPMRPLRNRNCS